MGKVIVIANQKGGVAKTTTAINASSLLAHLGYKVLLIDVDPQSNSTDGMGMERTSIKMSIYDCMIREVDPKKAIYKTKIKNLQIIPSTIHLSGAQIELVDRVAREFALKETVDKIKDQFNYIIIDTPPSLGLLTLNGLVAADSVLIPLQCEFYAMEGITQLINTIKLIQRKLNKELYIEGILLTMFDSRTNIAAQIVQEVTDVFKDKVFKTIIPRNVKVSEAPSYGKPINLYAPESSGAKSYIEFTKELIANEKAN